ncbi:hypothetical protein CVS40_11144 [Lucilia cuprina]|nr:hypothetical protein CVS40_11144 [Lucilia cuprina]
MNTRSQGSNNCRGRGRSGSASSNNISIELQDQATSSKARVVHSPAVKTTHKATLQVPRTQSCSNLDIQNISTMNNPNLLPQSFTHSQGQDSEVINQPELNVNAPSSNTATPFDTLITLMEQTMQNTREEFRRELSSIRDSISQIGNASNSSSQRQPFSPPNTSHSNAPNFNRPDVSTGYSDSNIKLEKWKICYDGTGSVSDFLFKVETLSRRTRCSDEHLLSNFHVLLEGKAEQWYWLFMKQNHNVTYSVIRYALTKEFGYLESEHDILLKISLRKQLHKESYDDFHTAIVSMNSRLQSPLPDSTVIDIIKRNLQANFRFLLFSSESKTLNDFRDIAQKAEKVLRDNKTFAPNSMPLRNVNEIEASESDVDESDISDPQLDALQMSKRSSKYDYSNIKCWNCLSYGHSYIYCDKAIIDQFCFKCGQKGVLTPTCPNRHMVQGNKTMGEMATGDFRPSRKTPSSN